MKRFFMLRWARRLFPRRSSSYADIHEAVKENEGLTLLVDRDYTLERPVVVRGDGTRIVGKNRPTLRVIEGQDFDMLDLRANHCLVASLHFEFNNFQKKRMLRKVEVMDKIERVADRLLDMADSHDVMDVRVVEESDHSIVLTANWADVKVD